MSDASEGRQEGLEIVGPVVVGMPTARGGYATTAYGNTQPQGNAARWLLVHPDGSATAYAGKVEYGQGGRSGFAMEVADELRLPLAEVDVVLGDTDQVPWDMGTFGSQSTGIVGLQLRKAAAVGRSKKRECVSRRTLAARRGLPSKMTTSRLSRSGIARTAACKTTLRYD